MQTTITNDDLDNGYIQLAGAVARQWLAEAPHELPAVANWLGIDAHLLLRGLGLRQVPPPPSAPPPLICEQCGCTMVQLAPGPRRRFCDDCRRRRGDDASAAAKRRRRGL